MYGKLILEQAKIARGGKKSIALLVSSQTASDCLFSKKNSVKINVNDSSRREQK